MTGMGVRWAAIVPERRPEQSDRAWIEAYQRRTSAARLRPYNRVAAAEVESQNATLTRQARAMADRSERRAVGRGRVNRLLGDAALANDVKRYREDRYKTLALIERLGSRRDRGAVISRSGRAAEHTGPDCQVCAEARRMESARASAPSAVRAGTGTGYCRGCGALADWCVCVQR